ncbi:uncharacterized protein PRCAT00006237001 [Priceomyces carsonii]|uniref:uncharacterized protein n=1 Tax=Priceomyces carsonii TaxID=28549 RepID=UPI002ED7DEAF|nr:unnamed protein product [Priceomyces carsonii]
MQRRLFECPICNRAHGINDSSILLCQNCRNEFQSIKLELDKNILINQFNKGCIDHVFSVTKELHMGKKVPYDDTFPEGLDNEMLVPSFNSIKTLAVQLSKLKNLNLMLKIELIKRSVEKFEGKISRISNEILEAEQALRNRETSVADGKKEMIIQFDKLSSSLHSSIEDYQVNKINQIEKQAIKLQFQHYMVLNEIFFSKGPNNRLMFYSQPILKLEGFLGYNILSINQFLENLIILQCHLSDLFKADLPYINELRSFLPNSDFYTLIKEKEKSMLGDENEEKEVEEVKSSPAETEIKSNNHQRVIKLGDRIQLPLSSKTINNQRRASLLRTETPQVRQKEPEEFNERPVLFKSNTTKRLVIVPHKILNRPFNKLTVKDFLKFLLVVVKILSNFKTFFSFTVNSSLTLEESNDFDFEEILLRLPNMHHYFEKRLAQLDVHSYLITPNLTSTSTATSTLSEESFSSAERPELKTLMENVYKLMMNGNDRNYDNSSNGSPDPPSLLKDLNLSDLIANQAKFHLGDWDIVSKIY